jgi:hypothetical protein
MLISIGSGVGLYPSQTGRAEGLDLKAQTGLSRHIQIKDTNEKAITQNPK